MHDNPTMLEIIAAATAFLREELMPQLTGSMAFQVRLTAKCARPDPGGR